MAAPKSKITEHDLILGKSFETRPSSSFTQLKFNFMPASADSTKPANLLINHSNEVSLKMHPNYEFKGKSENLDSGKDCILIIDHKKNTVTLEKISYNVTLTRSQSTVINPNQGALPIPSVSGNLKKDLKRLTKGSKKGKNSSSNSNNNNNSNNNSNNASKREPATANPNQAHKRGHLDTETLSLPNEQTTSSRPGSASGSQLSRGPSPAAAINQLNVTSHKRQKKEDQVLEQHITPRQEHPHQQHQQPQPQAQPHPHQDRQLPPESDSNSDESSEVNSGLSEVLLNAPEPLPLEGSVHSQPPTFAGGLLSASGSSDLSTENSTVLKEEELSNFVDSITKNIQDRPDHASALQGIGSLGSIGGLGSIKDLLESSLGAQSQPGQNQPPLQIEPPTDLVQALLTPANPNLSNITSEIIQNSKIGDQLRNLGYKDINQLQQICDFDSRPEDSDSDSGSSESGSSDNSDSSSSGEGPAGQGPGGPADPGVGLPGGLGEAVDNSYQGPVVDTFDDINTQISLSKQMRRDEFDQAGEDLVGSVSSSDDDSRGEL